MSPVMTSKHQLVFNDSSAVYLPAEEEERPDPFENNNGFRMVKRIGSDDICFTNFNTQLQVQQKELGDKQYLIQDTVRQPAWKIEQDTMLILGHVCRKAVLQNRNNQVVTAWFAENITPPAGPEMFGGLPGTILNLSINNGEMTYTALSISDKINPKQLQAPRKGVAITREEFDKKIKQLMGKGPQPGPGGGMMRINAD